MEQAASAIQQQFRKSHLDSRQGGKTELDVENTEHIHQTENHVAKEERLEKDDENEEEAGDLDRSQLYMIILVAVVGIGNSQENGRQNNRLLYEKRGYWRRRS